MRRRSSPAEDLLEISTRLPWWVGLLLALTSYFLLHQYTISDTASISMEPGKINIAPTLLKTMASIGQYLLPTVFIFGTLGSLIKRIKQGHLYSKASTNSPLKEISKMSWCEFEQFTAAVFRKKGYSVPDTKEGPDGGIDLVLKKNDEVYLVQCKHWKKYKVGVKVVRELYGVMASLGAVGGFVVTAGEYTKEARSFAESINIELIDGVILEGWLKPNEQRNEIRNPTVTGPLVDSLLLKRSSTRKRNGLKITVTLFAILMTIGAFYGLYSVMNDQLKKVVTSGAKGNSQASLSQSGSKIVNPLEIRKDAIEPQRSSAEIYIAGQSDQINTKSFNEWYQTPRKCLASAENPNPDMISCANKRLRARREFNKSK